MSALWTDDDSDDLDAQVRRFRKEERHQRVVSERALLAEGVPKPKVQRRKRNPNKKGKS